MPVQGTSCPVDHKAVAAALEEVKAGDAGDAAPAASHLPTAESFDGGSTPAPTPAGSGRCPVDHRSLNGHTRPPVAAGKCPVGHEAMRKAADNGHNAANDAPAQKPVCPYGFTSEKSSMTSLHCPRCRSLYFDCVRTPCGHNFCRECIKASPDCLTCGDSVSELKPEDYIQSMVETFIKTHSGDETFLEGKPIMKEGAADEKDAEATRATFLMELGLRSFAGGNLTAATERLDLCRAELLKMVASRGSTAVLSTQLGAVCGSQGDCYIRMGDNQSAVAHYETSIRYLEESEAASPEVQQALTVTQNKLGDLWYRAGDLTSAARLYEAALASRRRMATAAAGSDASKANLDLALSLAKLADIQLARHQETASRGSLEEAKQVSASLEGSRDSLDGPQKKRLDMLQTFLDGMPV